jgi:hypothetical protein
VAAQIGDGGSEVGHERIGMRLTAGSSALPLNLRLPKNL